MEQYVDTSKIYLQETDKKIVRKMIEKYHYSHRLSSCRYPLGVYYRKDNPHPFFKGEFEEEMVGSVSYGFPIGRRVLGSIFTEELGLETNNILELTRLFIHDGYGKNIESYVVGQSFQWLKENAPDIKVLISYADPEQNHAGGIYQATNWLYQGCGAIQLAPTFSLRLEEDGEWIHSRTVYSMYGSSDPKKLIPAIGKTFWLKKESSKHRYLYFLGTKKENRLYRKMLKHPLMPYPKEAMDDTEIRKIEVEEKHEVDRFVK